MKTVAQRKLARRLVGAVAIAFAASMVLTWMLHERMTQREMRRLFDNVFTDVSVDIRERVDERMFRQAMVLRDKVYEMREEPWWNDPDESSRRLRALAEDLGVDEICIADADGMLSHSARRDEVGALDFTKAEGQAREFASLLTDKYEVSQPLLPNTLRGEMVKYVGVWMPEGGFVQVGGSEKAVRNLARTALTGLTHGWHVSGDDGGIFITTGNGTIISHPEAGHEGGQWRDPGDDSYCEKRMIEGFPVYIVIPKHTAVVERRVLVATSAFLNGVALVLASILVGIVIAAYVRDQLAARKEQEIVMAANIQESSIPRVFPPFTEEKRMDVFATMQTARDVGGDFYDFYFSTPTRLVFLVADVSGKGIPAALYMMRAKATIKGVVQTGLPLAEVAARANDALSRDNDANMFVTAWIGELDLLTGSVTYVNAGHNPPLAIRSGFKTSYVRERSGLMFGAMPGVKYKARELRLSPGDMLYLYTDGITEQPDANGELFGEERLQGSIEAILRSGAAALKPGSSPLLVALFAAVVAHAAGADQADDCTQLIIRYNGDGTVPAQPDRQSRRHFFPATQEGIADASAFLDECIGPLDDGTLGAPLHIILDEAASNIVKHSGASGFEVEVAVAGHEVSLVFIDDGVPYDPLAHADPDTTKDLSERKIGGLGILMMKKLSNSVTYSREDNRNVLRVDKAF
jgi:serine phosphatase RsbU (regulator of sigma subunit)/anti-sigma regulatory factor (Ser/Thr protein kinase)